MHIITMGHTTVLRCIKNLKNDDNIESFKIKSDGRLVLRRGGERWKTVSKVTTLMSERAHSHVSMMADRIDDVEFVLDFSRSSNKKK